MARMRVAKPDQDDFDQLKNYLMRNEEKNSKYSRTFPHGWRRVFWAAVVLVTDYCDPLEDHLEESPYLYDKHVAPEQ